MSPNTTPVELLATAAVADDDLVAIRERFLSLYIEAKRLANREKTLRNEMAALREQLWDAMLERGEKSIKLENGVRLTREEGERFYFLAQDREQVLATVPPEFHTVNNSGATGGTFATWVKGVIDSQGEAALPAFVQRMLRKDFRVTGAAKLIGESYE